MFICGRESPEERVPPVGISGFSAEIQTAWQLPPKYHPEQEKGLRFLIISPNDKENNLTMDRPLSDSNGDR